MTDTDLSALRDDISFLKRLSSDRSARPAPALWLMAVFGGAFGLSGLTSYGMLSVAWATRDLTLIRLAAAPFYLGALIFLGALIWFGWVTLRGRKSAAPLSRAAKAAWTAALLGLVVVWSCFKIFAMDARHLPYSTGYIEHLFPAILLALWGAAWWVAGFTGERRWAWLIGPASFAAAVAAAWQANTVHILLIGGLSLLLLMAAPAIALLREPAKR